MGLVEMTAKDTATVLAEERTDLALERTRIASERDAHGVDTNLHFNDRIWLHHRKVFPIHAGRYCQRHRSASAGVAQFGNDSSLLWERWR